MDEREWAPRLTLSVPIVARDDLHIAAQPPTGATLLSGDIDAAIAALAPSAPCIGLGGMTGEPPYLLVIARDRGCLITPAPLEAETAWNRQGFALTPADDAWVFFVVSGTGAEAVIAEGCAADLAAGSPSAATLFAGHPALLVRNPKGFVLGVSAPEAESVARWLLAAATDAE